MSRSTLRHWLPAALILLLPATPAGCQSSAADARDEERTAALPDTPSAATPSPAAERTFSEEDLELFLEAAHVAWRGILANSEETGLISSTPHYDFATTWDMGSGLAAVFSAHRLGIIDDAEYEDRMGRMLKALAGLPLYEDAAYHKIYSTTSGRMAVNSKPSRTGYAWSATDLGRFMLWLRIIALEDPRFADEAEAIVRRMDLSRVVRDGYVWGHGRNRRSPYFQEGRIGYEQYVAEGFAAWGYPPEHALDLRRNAREIEVLGRPLLADVRGLDRLVSEPFVMMGLELGWTPEMRTLAEQVLDVMKARFEETGQVTIASEDAVSVPPYYFYYYCVYCNGKAFTVDVDEPGKQLDGPRWVSTKNSFGWYALLPNDYTKRALEEVQPARSEQGWSSGVFEGTRKSTETRDINTAAIILEAALYMKKGGPILDRAKLADAPR